MITLLDTYIEHRCIEENVGALPTLNFVGGETQDLLFNFYFRQTDRPLDLESYDVGFAIISNNNRGGEPIVAKDMTIKLGKDNVTANALAVKLSPEDTVNLCGKYYYQITIKDAVGDTEIPKQGIMYICGNIHKSYITNI